jgi:23S rRNA (uridine2552-2'-O)-methyltransferase
MKQTNRKHNRWEDHYARQARKDRYPARSVYKLQEIQQKNKLIRQGHKVLDLGCAPGSWLLYAAEIVGATGQVVGIDLKPVTIPLPGHVTVHTADIYGLPGGIESLGADFDVVISDMAPSTTGQRDTDAARSLGLCEAALDAAQRLLKPGGGFVCKIFQGEDFKAFSDQVKRHFQQHRIFKPQSSRKASKEIYIIGLGYQPGGKNVRS